MSNLDNLALDYAQKTLNNDAYNNAIKRRSAMVAEGDPEGKLQIHGGKIAVLTNALGLDVSDDKAFEAALGILQADRYTPINQVIEIVRESIQKSTQNKI